MNKGNKLRKYIGLGILLLAVVLLSAFVMMDIQAEAKLVRTGTVVKTDSLNVRTGPGTSNDAIGTFSGGSSGPILEEGTASNGRIWYKMTIGDLTGWVSSAYIEVSEVLEEIDEEFDKYLDEQGFPESYKDELQILHAKYPNWIFEAQPIDMDWEYVIEQESELGQTLVYYTSITSWKSMQTGAYNWETGTWKGFDGDKWVAASEEIIRYYMDPRNFLDETYVFQFLKQSYDASTMTEEQLLAKRAELALVVEGTYLAGTYIENEVEVSYQDTIMDVAAQTGVDPMMLASMMIQEQETQGTGGCISGTVEGYEGYYNYFNIGAYATSSMTAVQRGMWYASGSGKNATSYNRPWNTRTASILGGASYYGKNYVNAGQDTMYLKKYNVQGENPFTHEYMTNVQGAASEGKHVADGYNEVSRQNALVFKIPVFKNMPETPATKPTGNLDPNYMLKTLTVAGFSLTPTYSIYETEFAVTVPYETNKVTIEATAVSSKAKIEGIGEKSLKVGSNKYTIKTTAENGSVREITLTIVRKEAPAEIPNVSFGSSTYSVNENMTITGITNFPIKASDFMKMFTVENGSIKITDAKGNAISNNVGTGAQIRVYNNANELKHTYNVLIYGDANGDGQINAKDLLAIQKNNIKVKALSGLYLQAADVTRDGKVNAKDLLQVQKNNIKVSTIKQ